MPDSTYGTIRISIQTWFSGLTSYTVLVSKGSEEEIALFASLRIGHMSPMLSRSGLRHAQPLILTFDGVLGSDDDSDLVTNGARLWRCWRSGCSML